MAVSRFTFRRSGPLFERRLTEWRGLMSAKPSEPTRDAKGRLIMGTPTYNEMGVGVEGSPTGYKPHIAYHSYQLRTPPPGTPDMKTVLQNLFVPPVQPFNEGEPGDPLQLLKTAAQWSSAMQSSKQSRSAYVQIASLPESQRIGQILTFAPFTDNQIAKNEWHRVYIVVGADLDVFGRAGIIWVLENHCGKTAAYPVQLAAQAALHREGWVLLPRDYLWRNHSSQQLVAEAEHHEQLADQWRKTALSVHRGLAVSPPHSESWKLLPQYHASQAAYLRELIGRRTAVASGDFELESPSAEPWREQLELMSAESAAEAEAEADAKSA